MENKAKNRKCQGELRNWKHSQGQALKCIEFRSSPWHLMFFAVFSFGFIVFRVFPVFKKSSGGVRKPALELAMKTRKTRKTRKPQENKAKNNKCQGELRNWIHSQGPALKCIEFLSSPWHFLFFALFSCGFPVFPVFPVFRKSSGGVRKPAVELSMNTVRAWIAHVREHAHKLTHSHWNAFINPPSLKRCLGSAFTSWGIKLLLTVQVSDECSCGNIETCMSHYYANATHTYMHRCRCEWDGK